MTEEESLARAIELDTREATIRVRERVVANIVRDLKALQDTIDEYLSILAPIKE